jgi:hypothetical protein
VSQALQSTIITSNMNELGSGRPFPRHIPDYTMIDLTRLQLFDAVGRARHPFAGVATWPDLEQRIHEHSAALLATHGKDAWTRAGGIADDQGRPTLRPRASAAAGEVLRGVVKDPGGFLWADPLGGRWAVRLVPLVGREAGEYAGLAVSCQGAEMLLGQPGKEGVLRAIKDEQVALKATGDDDVRQRLAQMSHRLWLYERAELLFWAIQAAVLTQRRSMVTLPDVALGEDVWGGDCANWPRNWRGTLFTILRSLLTLRWAVLRLPRNGWRPRFGAEAVPIVRVEDRQVTAPVADRCDDACPLRNSGQRHGHFRVDIGPDFLGILERFAVVKNGAERRYNFTQDPDGKAGEEVEAARKAGTIVPAHMPTRLLGYAAGLTAGQRRIIDALVRETTRARPWRKTRRKIKGKHMPARTRKFRSGEVRVVRQGRVPGRTMRDWVICPLLDPGRSYVVFGGNGTRPGMGYRVRTWAERAGYLDPTAEGSQHAGVLAFLDDLHALAQDFRLVVAGFRPEAGHWLSGNLLVETARLPGGARELEQVHLRVYGPEDYLGRWKAHLAEKAGFALEPPSGVIVDGAPNDQPSSSTLPLTGDARADVLIRMRRLRITQSELAQHLDVKQPYVSRILAHGGPGIPQGRLQAIQKFLADREAAMQTQL